MSEDSRQFNVDIKGLVFNEEGKLMLLKEPNGKWDLPGGRLEHGENVQQALVRECREEMGVECKVLDELPQFMWTAHWQESDIYLVYLCFRIELSSFDFIDSNECCGFDFFTASELESLNTPKSIRPLKDWMLKTK